MQDFVANRKETTSNATDAQYFRNAAEDSMNYMEAKRNSDDKWILMCANFPQMSFDSFEFVEAYRVGDSIAIGYGYQMTSVGSWHT